MKNNKVSRKGVKLNFYTEEEIKELLTAIQSKEFKNERAIALAYSKKFNRSYPAVYSKVRYLNGKKPERVVVEKKVTKKQKEVPVAKIEVIEEVKPLTLPKGMTYQGTAKKVELHADHFRVYF